MNMVTAPTSSTEYFPRKIEIEFIPHEEQRYSTCGDWQFKDGVLHIKVSRLTTFRREVCVAIHELVEALTCFYDGVTEQQVDLWDLTHTKDADPGNVPGCPYQEQHEFATGIEMLLANKLGIVWSDYERELNELP